MNLMIAIILRIFVYHKMRHENLHIQFQYIFKRLVELSKRANIPTGDK